MMRILSIFESLCCMLNCNYSNSLDCLAWNENGVLLSLFAVVTSHLTVLVFIEYIKLSIYYIFEGH